MNNPTADYHSEPKYVPPDERRSHGKALREAVPREVHGHWKPTRDRRDIVDLLNESNEGRMEQLVPIRFGRMMLALSLAALTVVGLPMPGLVQAPTEPKPFSPEELDQMLAPIALYDDALLSQVLMAASYPLEIVEAARWSAANPNLKGDAASTISSG